MNSKVENYSVRFDECEDNIKQIQNDISSYKSSTRAWSGDTLTFNNMQRDNSFMYELTIMDSVSNDFARYLVIIRKSEDNIRVAKIGGSVDVSFTKLDNTSTDCTLVAKISKSSYWIYSLKKLITFN